VTAGQVPAQLSGTSWKVKADYQVAAPAETRTPTSTERTFAQQRVRMEGWRQRRMGSREDHSTIKGNYKSDLTLTGLLMEGLGLGGGTLLPIIAEGSCGAAGRRSAGPSAGDDYNPLNLALAFQIADPA
jgi:hypothetical protein